MAKKAYIGVNGVARKVKASYIGIETEVPVYGEENELLLTPNSISEYFTVQNGSYGFTGDWQGSVQYVSEWRATNLGIESSTASTIFTAKEDYSSLSITYGYETEQNYDLFSLSVGSTTIADSVSGSDGNTWIGSIKKGEKITATYYKDSSGSASGETCWIGNIYIKTRVQTGTVTQGIARKIKKAYIGIGGVARPCYALDPKMTNYGYTTQGLMNAVSVHSAGSIEDYALFAGGWTDSGVSSAVDVYTVSLSRQSASSLYIGAANMAVANTTNYVVFAGGSYASGNNSYSSYVSAYNNSLTRVSCSNVHHGWALGMASTGQYAMFAGGGDATSSVNLYYNTVSAYNDSLTKSTSSIRFTGVYPAGVTSGSYALFAGGYNFDADSSYFGSTANVDCFNNSITRFSASDFPYKTWKLDLVTSSNKYFGYGIYDDFGDKKRTVYMGSTRLLSAMSFDTAMKDYNVATAELNGRTIYAGCGDNYDIVEVYYGTTREIDCNLDTGRTLAAAASVGDYVLVGGGDNPNIGRLASVEAFTLM